MTINTKEKGITLIALIVTIIVLLILAGVTIISLTGENGILGKSSDVKLKREIAREIEQIKLSVNAVYTSYYDKGYLPVSALKTEMKKSYSDVENVEETSDIGGATKVSKAKKKVDLGSMFGTESIAAENEDVEPTQEFAKVTYTSKREYYVKIKKVTSGNSDPVGTIYSKGGTTEDDTSGNTIKYELNGGVNPENAPTSYKTGEVIGFPTPTKDGNAFEGWYQKSDFSDTMILRTNDTMSGDITLYAKWAEETDPSYFTWAEITSTSTQATITGLSTIGQEKYNNGELTELIIPKKYSNLPVTSIEYNTCFMENTLLKKLIIPDTVTFINNGIFQGCTSMEELTLPISLDPVCNKNMPIFGRDINVEKIHFTVGSTGEGYEITDGYYNYTPWSSANNKRIEVTMSEGITKIGRQMFTYCTGLTSLELPTTVTTVNDQAFLYCENWQNKVNIKQFTTIGDAAFMNCNNITGTFELSNNLTEIGGSAFRSCEKLTGTVDLSNIKSIGAFAFYECKGLTGEVKIPNGITKVDTQTFYNCEGITKLIIPDSVTTLADNAFAGCTNIKDLTIPISVNPVNNKNMPVFAGCNNIEKVHFTIGTTGEGYEITDGYYACTPWYYSSCNDKKIEVTMDEGITKIGRQMFTYCTGLTSLEIPSTVTTVNSEAFLYCENWQNKVNMKQFTTIGNAAFMHCNNITGTFELSNNLTEIGGSAFRSCEKLTGTVDLSNIKSIGAFAFYECKGLTGEVKIPNGITKVDTQTFYNCEGITKLIIPDSVTTLADNAFAGCTNIKDLTIPISVNPVNNKNMPVFAGCNNIEKVHFTIGTTGEGYEITDGYYACTPWYYSSCNDKKIEVTMDEGITKIGRQMFACSMGIVKLVVPDSVTSIGNSAFLGINESVIIYNGSATGAPWGATSD